MRLCIYIAFLLCSFTTVYAQKQVSFEYERVREGQYPIINYFQYQDELRLLTVEDNGEAVLVSIAGNTKDTLLIVNESQTEVPFSQVANDHYFVQLFLNKMVIIDLENFEVRTLPFTKEEGYSTVKIWERYIAYFNALSTNLRLINVEDYSELEVSRMFFNEEVNNHLYGLTLENDVYGIVVLNVESNQADTIYQSEEYIHVYPQEDELILMSGAALSHYEIATKTLTNIYTLNTTNDEDFFFYQDELIFIENVDSSGHLTTMSFDGSITQEYILQDTFPHWISKVVFKGPDGDYIFSGFSSKSFRTKNLEQVVLISAMSARSFFSDISEEVLYLVQDDGLKYYDPITDTFTELDTVFSTWIGNPRFENLYQIDGQWYLEYKGELYVDYDQSGGMKQYVPINFRPEGLSDEIELLQTTSDLYVEDDKTLYRFDGTEFEEMSSLRIESDIFEFNDRVYIQGRNNNVDWGLFSIQDGGSIVLDASYNGQPLSKTANGQYLLSRDHPFGDYAYSAADENQGGDFYALDFMPKRNFSLLGASSGSSIYLRTSDNGEWVIWELNLEMNTIDSIFSPERTIFRAYSLDDKIIARSSDSTGNSILHFIDVETHTVETFTPPSIGEYHLSIFDVRCANSLLIEIATADCSYASIWSTDGTIANTYKLVENSVPVDRVFNDMGLHEYEDELYFSVHTGNNIHDHYRYDCMTQEAVLEDYPDDIVLGRRFKAGGTDFGVIQKDIVNGHALVDLTDPTNPSQVAALGSFKKQFGVFNLYNISEGLPYGDSTRQLAVLNIDPLGEEMYYVYADGTLELLTDINPGIADAFLVAKNIQYRPEGVTRLTVFQDQLFFDAHHRETGHQMYNMPTGSFVSVDAELEDLPIQVKLYPNPAVDEIQLRTDQMTAFNWTILTQDGQLLRRGVGAHQETRLDVSALTAGLHYLLIELDNRTFVKAFVKL